MDKLSKRDRDDLKTFLTERKSQLVSQLIKVGVDDLRHLQGRVEMLDELLRALDNIEKDRDSQTATLINKH